MKYICAILVWKRESRTKLAKEEKNLMDNYVEIGVDFFISLPTKKKKPKKKFILSVQEMK